ncbi:pyridoxal-dependent aspartate 1-decarboxylase PanP [Shewanella sp. NIFS-20-20]|uniref:pyridoxal-dependent aspartate 1-decarboxylase PanP n=1 Tax=Shewanella sp. NIFS-20-20 TaxID=2853806 RepID=UPI001C485B87|nr:putative pyridoxal-dependent aspartate 1-decarboxylase [Shewanella sp. NIFS-20-20]MBV7316577.1 putative pyridoxal-dependent aspartate 1-decarboxylase [Shewanella sp. NIFS-20-20]
MTSASRTQTTFASSSGLLPALEGTDAQAPQTTSPASIAIASTDAILKVFTVPEAPNSTLGQIEAKLSHDLAGFLRDNIAALEKPLSDIEQDFSQHKIPTTPRFVSDYVDEIMHTLVAHSVHTAAPSFIGHMTSALPHFVLPLSKIMVALNQNLVKIETSKAFTPLERQVLGMMHHLIYQRNADFYQAFQHQANTALGAFCSGGTIANITALWVARNRLLQPDGEFLGVHRHGLVRALRHYGFDDIAILVSERGHYSLAKAADLLGIGRANIISIATTAHNKVDIKAMRAQAEDLKRQNIRVMAIVGVAGTTETGNIDDLSALADLATELDCHFHVDAAWGGASLLSSKYRHLLQAIERADSVTIDAHKQMYVPMGAGMVLFKDPSASHAIVHHAEYILRQGSKDLGSQTLEGSRPGMALQVHACLQIIGQQGYEILINRSIEMAHAFAAKINQNADFELTSAPELCILTYRYVPAIVQQAIGKLINSNNIAQIGGQTPVECLERLQLLLDDLTQHIQKTQRELGKSFVSRTRIPPASMPLRKSVVFRVVLANPLTTEEIIDAVLIEQANIASAEQDVMPRLITLANAVLAQL